MGGLQLSLISRDWASKVAKQKLLVHCLHHLESASSSIVFLNMIRLFFPVGHSLQEVIFLTQ